jgi:hypothetical protein
VKRTAFKAPRWPDIPDRGAELSSIVADRCRARMSSDLGADAQKPIVERGWVRMAGELTLETPRPAPKEQVHRSDAWLRAVAELPCVICGAHGTQAAHRNEGKAMSRKTDDALTASLCPSCHSAIDQGAAMTREQRRSEMDRAIVLTVRELARAGRLVIVA